eukprot:Nk52_evm3s2650 gene=Nk52_evmTU3s2650
MEGPSEEQCDVQKPARLGGEVGRREEEVLSPNSSFSFISSTLYRSRHLYAARNQENQLFPSTLGQNAENITPWGLGLECSGSWYDASTYDLVSSSLAEEPSTSKTSTLPKEPSSSSPVGSYSHTKRVLAALHKALVDPKRYEDLSIMGTSRGGACVQVVGKLGESALAERNRKLAKGADQNPPAQMDRWLASPEKQRMFKVLVAGKKEGWDLQWQLAQSEHNFLLGMQHTGVVPEFYELIPIGTSYAVLVMEYIDMPTLQQSVQDLTVFGRLSLHKFLAIAKALLRALAKIHQAGVVHRDVKLTNFLLDERTMTVKVIDFSVAGLHGEAFVNCSGTLAFMAPEEFTRSTGLLNYCMDIYGLGVTFFYMLTGNVPFHSPEYEEVVRCHLFVAPPRITDVTNFKSHSSVNSANSDISSFGRETSHSSLEATAETSTLRGCKVKTTSHKSDELVPDSSRSEISQESSHGNSHYPNWLADVIDKMLNKLPEERYQSCNVIYHDLCILELYAENRWLVRLKDVMWPSTIPEIGRYSLRRTSWINALEGELDPFKGGEGDAGKRKKLLHGYGDGSYGQIVISPDNVDALFDDTEEYLKGSRRYRNTLAFQGNDLYLIEDDIVALESQVKTIEKPMLVTVSGLSGSGKSTLVLQLKESLPDTYVFAWAKCEDTNRYLPYLALYRSMSSLVDELCNRTGPEATQVKKLLEEDRYINWNILQEFAPNVTNLVSIPFISESVALDLGAKKRIVVETLSGFLSCVAKVYEPILFFDDIMWADPDTLSLTKELMELSNISLTVIFAYRSNEVSEMHPVMELCRSVEAKGRLYNYERSSLSSNDVTSIVQSQTGIKDPHVLDCITDFIMSRTSCVVYDVVNMLRHMERNGILVYCSIMSSWVCIAPEKLGTSSLTKVSATKAHIESLSEPMQAFLKTAAVYGSEFERQFIVDLLKDKYDTEGLDVELKMMCAQLLLVNCDYPKNIVDEEHFADESTMNRMRFYHDTVQEAILTLVGDSEKQNIYEKIALKLAKETDEDVLSEPAIVDPTLFFRMASYLNNALRDTASTVLLQTAVKCNLFAAEYALHKMSSTQGAQMFARTGYDHMIALYGERTFEKDYKAAYQLNIILAESSGYVDMESEEFRGSIDRLLEHSKDREDETKVCLVQLKSFQSHNAFARCLEYGFKTLQLFPEYFPLAEMPSMELAVEMLDGVDQALIDRKMVIEDLANMEMCEDPEFSLFGDLVTFVMPCAYMLGDFAFYTYMPALSVQLIVRHGLAESSGPQIAVHGFSRAVFHNRFESGHRFSIIGHSIISKMFPNSKSLLCISNFFAGLTVMYGSSPLLVLDYYNRAWDCAIDSGNVNYRLYSWALWVWLSYSIGNDISFIERNCSVKLAASAHLSHSNFYISMDAINAAFKYYMGLTDEIEPVNSLDLLLGEGDPVTVVGYFITRMSLSIHENDIGAAVEFANSAQKVLVGCKGLSTFFEYHSIRPILEIILWETEHIGVHNSASEEPKKTVKSKEELLECVKFYINELEEFKGLSPLFVVRYLLLTAEFMRLSGEAGTDCLQMYHQALDIGKENDFSMMCGLICRRMYYALNALHLDIVANQMLHLSFQFYNKAGTIRICLIPMYHAYQNEVSYSSGARKSSTHGSSNGHRGHNAHQSNPNRFPSLENRDVGEETHYPSNTQKLVREDILARRDTKMTNMMMELVAETASLKEMKLKVMEVVTKYSGAQRTALLLHADSMGDNARNELAYITSFPSPNVTEESSLVLQALYADEHCEVEPEKLASAYADAYCSSMVDIVARTKKLVRYHAEKSTKDMSDRYEKDRISLNTSISVDSDGAWGLESSSASSVTFGKMGYIGGGTLAGDPYVKTNFPFEIIGIPLICRKVLVGVLYLETRVRGGGFDREILEVLTNISSQVAICIQSAALAETLEQKVEERAFLLKEKERVASETAFLLSIVLEQNKDGTIAIDADKGTIFLMNTEFARKLDLPKRSSTYIGQTFGELMEHVVALKCPNEDDMKESEIFALSDEDEDRGVSSSAEYKTMGWRTFVSCLREIVSSTSTAIEPFDVFVNERIYFTVVRLRLDSGSTIISLGDRTEKHFENELRQKLAVEARNDFLAFMCHELRNPLNGTLGLAEFLLETNLTEMQEEYVRHIRGCSHLMATIVNDVLDFSKLEAGAFEIDEEELDIRALVNQCVKLQVIAVVKSSELKMLVEVDDDVPERIVGDHARLQQIIINLTSNAIKFTPKGTITVRVSVVNLENKRKSLHSPGTSAVNGKEYLSVEIIDTGIGINESACRKLFSKYYQIKNEYSKKATGTGLGLRICKGLVTQMKGQIGVKSKVGIGTTFWFEIPLQRGKTSGLAEPKTPENGSSKSRESPALRVPEVTAKSSVNVRQQERVEEAAVVAEDVSFEGKRALVVDDDKLCRMIASRFVAKAQLDVDVVENGQQAVDMVKKMASESEKGISYYDVIFMDMCMPNMGGQEAIELLRGANVGYKGVILALTANAVESEKQEVLKIGANGFIRKPCTFERILVSLNNAFQK